MLVVVYCRAAATVPHAENVPEVVPETLMVVLVSRVAEPETYAVVSEVPLVDWVAWLIVVEVPGAVVSPSTTAVVLPVVVPLVNVTVLIDWLVVVWPLVVVVTEPLSPPQAVVRADMVVMPEMVEACV